MKKNILLTLLVLSMFKPFAQTITLSFDAKIASTQNSIALVSVNVLNQTHGCDTTLYGAAPTLEIPMLIGMDDEPSLAFDLSPNQPNPFNGQTTLTIHIPANGQLALQLVDNMGKLLSILNGEYPAGAHTFQLEVGEPGLVFLNAHYGNETRSVKLVNTATATGSSSIGLLESNAHFTKNAYANSGSGFVYNKGNQLVYTAMANGYANKTLLDSPTANKAYTFEMVPTAATVITSAITYLATNYAICGGNVVSDGGLPVVMRGICWATTPNPEFSGNHINNGVGVGEFPCSISGLAPSTIYYVRAYLKNSTGFVYGNEVIFSTLSTLNCGALTINHVAGSVAPVSKTVTYGTVNNVDGEPSKCWITQNLGADHQATSPEDITDASAGWYWQFNRKQGYMYENQSRVPSLYWNDNIYENADWHPLNDPCRIELGTTWRLPTYTEWDNVDASGSWNSMYGPWNSRLKLHLAGSFQVAGDLIIERGQVGSYWSKANVDGLNGRILKIYSSFCTVGLSKKTAGIPVRCIKPGGGLANVITKEVNNISTRTAASGGDVSWGGGNVVTARGVCWSTSNNPTMALSTKTNDGTGIGYYSSQITGLNPNTLYFVRAYASDNVDTIYGAERSFTTLDVLPTLSTSPISTITDSTSTSGGNISYGGDTPIIERGVCWSAVPNPTIALSTKTLDGSGMGSFTSHVSGLSANTRYYLRAYATNSNGTSYGNEFNFIARTCNKPITINHVAGLVAPVNKTVAYGTVNNIPGEPLKCWITQNLGAGNQPLSVKDTSEASAGWYWQFNRKQGYKHDGVNRTPNTWVGTINENINWEPANDPCMIEIGGNWRLPTSSEWRNVYKGESWINWNGAWNSNLKLHAAGMLENGGMIERGSWGYYQSSTTEAPEVGIFLEINKNICLLDIEYKTVALSVRCLSDSDAQGNLPKVTTDTLTNITQSSAICGGNVITEGSYEVTEKGVCWSTSPNPTSALPTKTIDGSGVGSFTSSITGLNASTRYYVKAYANFNGFTVYGQELSFVAHSCGTPLIISHIAGKVVPETKTISYETVTDVPGEPGKCWIAQNLGAYHQATAVNDATEASAGWYWRFNQMKGLKVYGDKTDQSWTTSQQIMYSDWLPANDPCTLELGYGWHVPTKTEWENVHNVGNWTNWNGPWSSALKLHAAGNLGFWTVGVYDRGTIGYYWSINQSSLVSGWHLNFSSTSSSISDANKGYLYPVRCIKEN